MVSGSATVYCGGIRSRGLHFYAWFIVAERQTEEKRQAATVPQQRVRGPINEDFVPSPLFSDDMGPASPLGRIEFLRGDEQLPTYQRSPPQDGKDDLASFPLLLCLLTFSGETMIWLMVA